MNQSLFTRHGLPRTGMYILEAQVMRSNSLKIVRIPLRLFNNTDLAGLVVPYVFRIAQTLWPGTISINSQVTTTIEALHNYRALHIPKEDFPLYNYSGQLSEDQISTALFIKVSQKEWDAEIIAGWLPQITKHS